jgi:predicted secreted protein
LSRRAFLALGGAAAGLLVEAAGRGARGDPQGTDAAHHLPEIRLPILTENGAKVPIVVEMAHPMEAAHYIRSLEIRNPSDPIPSKGTFEFTPANGHLYLAFQARLHDGVSEVTAVVECSRYGRYAAAGAVKVAEGAGGCAAPTPPAPAASDAIHPPAIRIPRLVREGRLRSGEVVDVQVTMRHPSRTGLALRDGVFVQVGEPFFLSELVAWYGDERISRFALTPALSDNPLITFRLRATRAEPLRVVLTNSRGQRFETVHPVRFA